MKSYYKLLLLLSIFGVSSCTLLGEGTGDGTIYVDPFGIPRTVDYRSLESLSGGTKDKPWRDLSGIILGGFGAVPTTNLFAKAGDYPGTGYDIFLDNILLADFNPDTNTYLSYTISGGWNEDYTEIIGYSRVRVGVHLQEYAILQNFIFDNAIVSGGFDFDFNPVIISNCIFISDTGGVELLDIADNSNAQAIDCQFFYTTNSPY